MQVYKNIENTRYVINRVFAGTKTPAMLIEQRILDGKSNISPLTDNLNSMYNQPNGSIQSKEVL